MCRIPCFLKYDEVQPHVALGTQQVSEQSNYIFISVACMFPLLKQSFSHMSDRATVSFHFASHNLICYFSGRLSVCGCVAAGNRLIDSLQHKNLDSSPTHRQIVPIALVVKLSWPLCRVNLSCVSLSTSGTTACLSAPLSFARRLSASASFTCQCCSLLFISIITILHLISNSSPWSTWSKLVITT